jgi:hypothetical protein
LHQSPSVWSYLFVSVFNCFKLPVLNNGPFEFTFHHVSNDQFQLMNSSRSHFIFTKVTSPALSENEMSLNLYLLKYLIPRMVGLRNIKRVFPRFVGLRKIKTIPRFNGLRNIKSSFPVLSDYGISSVSFPGLTDYGISNHHSPV